MKNVGMYTNFTLIGQLLQK